jgi:hypothetical protein
VTDLARGPEDDAFVRTAIRGMRPPDHHPDFWDALAGRLDAAEERAAHSESVEAVFGPPGSLDAEALRPKARERARPAHRAADHAPRRAPLRAVPAPAAPPTQVHIDAPSAAVPAVAAAADAVREPAFRPAAIAATTAAAIAGKGVRSVDPLAKLTVRHDAATLPHTMRRASNAVLVALALVAVVVAVVAGLSLVRQRSEDGAPVPLEQPGEPGDALLDDLAA